MRKINIARKTCFKCYFSALCPANEIRVTWAIWLRARIEREWWDCYCHWKLGSVERMPGWYRHRIPRFDVQWLKNLSHLRTGIGSFWIFGKIGPAPAPASDPCSNHLLLIKSEETWKRQNVIFSIAWYKKKVRWKLVQMIKNFTKASLKVSPLTPTLMFFFHLNEIYFSLHLKWRFSQ